MMAPGSPDAFSHLAKDPNGRLYLQQGDPRPIDADR
jgi:hypothetical protein